MSRPVVVDTSVAFKWLAPAEEHGVETAEALLADHLGGAVALAGPVSLPLELANGLRYAGLSQSDVLELVDEFDLLHIELFDLDRALLGDATRLAFRHGIAVYDAVFLALARQLDCELVTADRRAFARTGPLDGVRLI
ncbi:MAG: hypothetical protein C0418_05305 [Coriobacteriaceae bacterium]|nr:hypothetical protein [Coriobacteriaceae bacterium]